MKFRYKFPKLVFVIFLILTVVEIATIVYFILSICGVWGLPVNIPNAITMTAVCTLGLAFSLFMLTLHYKISDTNFELRFGFFDLLRKKVLISKICNIVYKESENLIFLSYMATDTLDPIIMTVAVDAKKTDRLAKTLQSINSNIVFIAK